MVKLYLIINPTILIMHNKYLVKPKNINFLESENDTLYRTKV